MGILEILTIIFVVAKLFGAITWSWFLVLLPLFVSLTIYLTMLIFSLSAFNMGVKKIKKRKW